MPSAPSISPFRFTHYLSLCCKPALRSLSTRYYTGCYFSELFNCVLSSLRRLSTLFSFIKSLLVNTQLIGSGTIYSHPSLAYYDDQPFNITHPPQKLRLVPTHLIEMLKTYSSYHLASSGSCQGSVHCRSLQLSSFQYLILLL